MIPLKKSDRGAPPSRRVSRIRSSSRPFILVGLVLAALIYGFLFLSQPVGNGLVDDDGRAITRGGVVFSTLFMPERLFASWFDGGRLQSGFSDRLPLAIATFLWLSLATQVGWPSVSNVLRGRDAAARLERMSLAALAGLGLLSTVTLLVGLAGGLASPWPLAAACGGSALVAVAVSYLMRRWSASVASPDVAEQRAHAPTGEGGGVFDRCLLLITIGCTCWLAALVMLGAWVPSAEFDVLEYHLQAPKEFFQQGAIDYLPHNIYANMPLGAEMHTLAMMTFIGQSDAWLGGLIGKSIVASITLLGAVLLGAYVARRLGAPSGWAAAGIWLASPGIAQSAMLGLIDGVVATYVLAAGVSVTYAIELSGGLREKGGARVAGWFELQPATLNWWWLAGLLSGAAAAAKYPALLFAVVPAVAGFAWIALRSQRRYSPTIDPVVKHRVRCALVQATGLIILGLATTCGPWYAKNWFMAGNPVYPLAAGIFGGKTLTPEKIDQWQQAHRVPSSAAPTAGAAERLLSEVRAAADDLLRLTLTSPFVQPAMICGLLVAIAVMLGRGDSHRRDDPQSALRLNAWRYWLIWSLWIVSVWWLATHRIDRFWLPLTGLWAGLSAVGLRTVRSDISPWLAHAILIFGLGYGSLLNSTSLVSDNRYFVSLAALRDDAGDERQVPRITQEQAWINQHLDTGGSRVLLIGEARVFEYRVPILYSTCFDTNPGETLLRDRAPLEQSAALRERGITHIMVNWGEIARYRGPGNYGFSDWPQPDDFQRLLDERVVTKVDWGIPDSSATLLRVE